MNYHDPRISFFVNTYSLNILSNKMLWYQIIWENIVFISFLMKICLLVSQGKFSDENLIFEKTAFCYQILWTYDFYVSQKIKSYLLSINSSYNQFTI